MYFYDDNGNVAHATVVSSVAKNEISYAGNSKRRFDANLSKVLKSGDFAGVYIVRLKDEQ